ncbi:DUF4280 domain-containing protein [uncultured Aquincola sp.]|uniref:DUF4280 domain-containing protein n=1 Tax=uncultured Aquincola sp. TaxID=886556 RepID=UPI0032B2A91B
MPHQTCTGGLLKCSFGMAPSTFVATPRPILTSNMAAGNIMDHVPMSNIMPFGMCQSLANPTVASATAAALGVLTPMPCVPNTPTPWAPGVPTVLLDQMPALDQNCKLMCLWGGVIEFTQPGQMTHQIP